MQISCKFNFISSALLSLGLWKMIFSSKTGGQGKRFRYFNMLSSSGLSHFLSAWAQVLLDSSIILQLRI